MTVDGAQFTSQWVQKMALEGRMYTWHSGTGTAPTTFAGAYVNTTPDIDMSVPAGVAFVPVYLTVQFETYGTILLTEVVAAAGVGGAIGSAGTVVAAVNSRLDIGDTSGITVKKAATSATYMTSNVVEFFRDGHQADVTASAIATGDQASNLPKFKWNALTDGNWTVMYSPSSITRLNVFACSQAGTGFITVTGIVLPTVSEE